MATSVRTFESLVRTTQPTHPPPPPGFPDAAADNAFQITAQTAGATALALTAREHHLAVGGANGKVTILETTGWSLVAVLSGHRQAVTSICTTEAGMLVTASRDGTLRMWSIEEGAVSQEKHQTVSHLSQITAVACTPSGSIATASADRSVIVWTEAAPSGSGYASPMGGSIGRSAGRRRRSSSLASSSAPPSLDGGGEVSPNALAAGLSQVGRNSLAARSVIGPSQRRRRFRIFDGYRAPLVAIAVCTPIQSAVAATDLATVTAKGELVVRHIRAGRKLFTDSPRPAGVSCTCVSATGALCLLNLVVFGKTWFAMRSRCDEMRGLCRWAGGGDYRTLAAIVWRRRVVVHAGRRVTCDARPLLWFVICRLGRHGNCGGI